MPAAPPVIKATFFFEGSKRFLRRFPVVTVGIGGERMTVPCGAAADAVAAMLVFKELENWRWALCGDFKQRIAEFNRRQEFERRRELERSAGRR